MVKVLLTAVAALSISYSASATEKSDIWKCVDNKTLNAEQSCLTKTFEKNSDSEFFQELAFKDFSANRDAFATVTYFPKKNLIEVKSLEEKTTALLANNR